jgi:hypothetical protein
MRVVAGLKRAKQLAAEFHPTRLFLHRHAIQCKSWSAAEQAFAALPVLDSRR